MKILILLLLSYSAFGQLEITDTVTPRPPVKIGNEVPLTCFTSDAESFALELLDGVSISDLASHCISIYVETDRYTYLQHGSVAATEQWIKDIIDQVKVLYANEGISIRLSSTYIPTTVGEDWSATYNSASAILYEFGTLRGDTINGRLKHFFTMRGLGGGIAWVNTLCTPQTFFTFGQGAFGPYAVSANLTLNTQPFPIYNWNTMVVAHEMGHNLGSPHTQKCIWGPNNNQAIDDCWTQEGGPCDLVMPVEYSTIMSYCHLVMQGIDFTKGFGTLPGNLIRASVNNASCVAVSQIPKLVLNGSVTGIHSADTIQLINAEANNLILMANVVEIENSDIFPIFELNKLNSCDE